MRVSKQIEIVLKAEFSPLRLSVINESHLHAGHAGDDGSGESHFRVEIVSGAFTGKTRLERHRMVQEALKDLQKSQIHALSIQAKTPDEDNS